MQLSGSLIGYESSVYLFQSSPGQKAGCNRVPSGTNPHGAARGDLFQSSPGQKAGCNRVMLSPYLQGEPVSILTRPEGRMQWSM